MKALVGAFNQERGFLRDCENQLWNRLIVLQHYTRHVSHRHIPHRALTTVSCGSGFNTQTNWADRFPGTSQWAFYGLLWLMSSCPVLMAHNTCYLFCYTMTPNGPSFDSPFLCQHGQQMRHYKLYCELQIDGYCHLPTIYPTFFLFLHTHCV